MVYMENIVTRFAPSPTGDLHIGSARTALFSYLFARHHRGKFLLRIEDTDRQRSTEAAVKVLLDGLKWLEIDWDEEEIYQSSRSARHREVALELLNKGKAYKCFLSPEELSLLREKSMIDGKPIESKWRDVDRNEHPNLPYVIRIKAPKEGVTIVNDQVQGKVVTENTTLDDMILLRSDGTPTYMHAVVVDDHDMGITHIIRGDDHLSNTARQIMIYQSMGWQIPIFAHIPLIHGSDGKKLSKRHGALSVTAYEEMGYLPETLCNYLLRLGWSHKDDEIISKEQAIEWFNLESIGKSPARLDFQKLDNLNNHYLQKAENSRLLKLMNLELSNSDYNNLIKGLDSLKQRAKTLIDLKSMTDIYIVEKKISISQEMKEKISTHYNLIESFLKTINQENDWSKDSLMELAKAFVANNNIKLGDLAYILRIILTGSNASPSVFEIISIVGKEALLKRFNDAYNT
jgi:glutamyl-tRNA synthetase